MTPEEKLEAAILANVPAEALVLDVGSGMAQYHAALLGESAPRVDQLVLLDAHAPYLGERAQRFAKEIELSRVVLLHGEALAVLRTVDDECLDVVMAIDFVEHLVLDDAIRVVNEMKRALKPGGKLLVFVPEGNHPQDKDHFQSGGDFWQTHRSTWYLDDVRNFLHIPMVERWEGFHAGTPGKDENALWCVWEK